MTRLFDLPLTERQIEIAKAMDPPWRHHFHFRNYSTGGLWNQNHMNFIESNLPPFQDQTVLDIGFCDGYYSFMAEAHGAKSVTGVDIYLRPTIPFLTEVLGSNCLLMEEDVTVWESAEEFDLVLCLGVFYHTPDLHDLLDAVAERTRPGGYAVFEGPVMGGRINRLVPLPQWARLAPHPQVQPNPFFWKPTLSTLTALIRLVGFNVIEYRFMWGRVLLTARRT